jgi:hypothetical protein
MSFMKKQKQVNLACEVEVTLQELDLILSELKEMRNPTQLNSKEVKHGNTN